MAFWLIHSSVLLKFKDCSFLFSWIFTTDEEWVEQKNIVKNAKKLSKTNFGVCVYNIVSKVGNRSQGWPESSLFNSYYTEV